MLTMVTKIKGTRIPPRPTNHFTATVLLYSRSSPIFDLHDNHQFGLFRPVISDHSLAQPSSNKCHPYTNQLSSPTRLPTSPQRKATRLLRALSNPGPASRLRSYPGPSSTDPRHRLRALRIQALRRRRSRPPA